MSAIITLTTDFGLQDAYVASMKGAILTVNSKATIVDISHSIEPQNISQAAFVIAAACPYFPPDTVHVVVVDPGVGSNRQAVVVKTPVAFFVAPDNGVLTYAITRALEDAHFVTRGITLDDATQIEVGEVVEAVSATNRRFWHQAVSPTFHGRDIFAPVAAHLSLGTPFTEFGDKMKSLCIFPTPYVHSLPDGTLLGTVIHIDRFGNLVTNIRVSELPKGDIAIQAGKHSIAGLSQYYAEGDGLLATIGSNNYLEVAVRNGSAQAYLNARIGDEVRVKVTPPEAQPNSKPPPKDTADTP
ncbi:MAG: SAM-dependent chlorinase/fluorinase [Chloroflexota bacterium]